MDQRLSITQGLLRSPPAWALLILLVGITLFPVCCAEMVWSGSETLPLVFVVIDGTTHNPIAGARVQLNKYETPPERTYVTDQNGTIRFTQRFQVAGRSSLFRETRGVHYGIWELNVEADGYESLKVPLNTLTEDHRFHDHGSTPPPILIRLAKQFCFIYHRPHKIIIS